MMLGRQQHEIHTLVQRVFLPEQLQADDIATLQSDICYQVIGRDPEGLVLCRRRRVWRYGVAWLLLRSGRRLRRHAGAGHRRLNRTLLRDRRGWWPVFLLAGIPKEQERERKHEEQAQALRIHGGSGNRVITC